MTLPNGEQGVHEASVVVAKEEWQAMVDEQAKLRQKVADQEARIRGLVEYEKMYHAWNTLGGAPPRVCELEEMRRTGISGRELLEEIEQMFAVEVNGGGS